MTTTNGLAASFPTADAQLALAERCGLDPRNTRKHGYFFTLPGVLYDAWSHAVGANSFPSEENTERKFDTFEAVSVAYGISVDEVVRWSEVWADALVVS